MNMNKNFETLEYSVEGDIGYLTFNRPKALNAISAQVIEDLIEFSEWAKDEKIKGLIVTGSGEKAFIAGADIKAMCSMDSKEATEFSARGQKATLLLENLPFPVIAAVNGFALGGGLEMALACDFMLASDNAVFGLPEASLGLVPGFGGTQRLAKIVGINRAKELIYTGRMVKIEEAKSMGLVLSSYADKTQLIEACVDLIKKSSKNSINAISVAKTALNKGLELSIEDGLKIESASFGEIFSSYDMKEGTQAFMEKRKPNFKGE
ncbi:MAG: enoyl-CoA hydratase/isomerase family protein [Bacteriovoracaceae bacterium]|nr:enoyl-CoA hydratase/isomerase family protein [Bacteriovoracaceae bacterium]